MSTRRTPWPAGTPCWTDLVVPDVDVAVGFYAAVLGWDVVRFGEEYGGYAIGRVGDRAAAGIGPAQAGQLSAWTLYLASDDADATAAAVTAHGGSVVMAPGDVGALGRMFLALDPTGAVFGVWQAGEHIGAQVTSEPGGLAWEDLRSTDPDASRAFYSGVFGYRTTPLAMAGADYATFVWPGDPAPLGGMGGLMGDEGPSHWLVYFGVPDTDAAVAATLDQGGAVRTPATDTPFGRMATLADPFGAVFVAMQNTGQTMPDRGGVSPATAGRRAAWANGRRRRT